MAVFESQTLRDLIQNNIDYVAKQVGVINDFLFGETSDGDDVIPQMPYVLHTCQLMAVNPETTFDIPLNWTQYAIANINIDSSGLHVDCFDVLRSSYGNVSDMQRVDNEVLPYIRTYSAYSSLEDMGVDFIYNSSEFIMGIKDNGEVYPVYFDSVFNGINGHQQLQLALTPKQTYAYRGEICDTWNVASGFYSDRFYFQQVDNDNIPSRMIVMPNSQSTYTYNYIDNSTVQTINYNGDTIYNYYNDNGDIIINGGGIGGGGAVIAPVGGLAYADVKFILDSLIDDLNLHFDFAGDGVEPLAPAPTLEELRYIDQGSFYITPVKQIPALPAAPDVADTFIDVSDYVALLGGSVTKLTSIFGSIGLDMMLVLTFLSCLVIRHLRR